MVGFRAVAAGPAPRGGGTMTDVIRSKRLRLREASGDDLEAVRDLLGGTPRALACSAPFRTDVAPAALDQILLSAPGRELAGGQFRDMVDSQEPLMVKGFDELVDVYQLSAERMPLISGPATR